ncbi:hypothetical protein DFS34DRAFT_650845 [Phlyctochytrium arcticum]|nr:hypothetical protein DFS34DRAFT_650845 [Phlyctochytrium arcticum]
MVRLQKLSEETVCRLRSTVVIVSLAQCVVELVQNAIDANAKVVQILVNPQTGYIQVSDNGDGIPLEGFDLLGERYVTSKAGNENGTKSYGFRGEGLASIGQVSRLEIISKADYPKAQQLVIKGGERIYMGPAFAGQRQGTTVIARDVFYNYPVRRKRLLAEDIMEPIRRAMEPLALARPDISFSLVDQIKNVKILATHRAESPVSIFRQLFGVSLSMNLKVAQKAKKGYCLHGFLSTDSFPSKYHQYMLVNEHLIASCPLHKYINDLFEKSSFAQEDQSLGLALEGAESDLNKLDRSSRPKFTLRSGKKHPIFFLKLTCPANTFDILLDPAKNMVQFENADFVHTLIKELVSNFLVENGFLGSNDDINSLNGHHSDEESTDEAHDVNDVDFGVDPSFESHLTRLPAFENALGFKSAKGLSYEDFQSSGHGATKLLQKQKLQREKEAMSGTQIIEGNEYEVWKDPRSRKQYWVDTRTGNSYNVRPGKRKSDTADQVSNRVDNQVLKSKRLKVAPQVTLSHMRAEDSLKKWKNPVFKASESSVVTLSVNSDLPSQTNTSFASKATQGFNGLLTEDVIKSIDKSSLNKLVAISQVDNKFLACRLTQASDDTDLLLLIDQHAADERVKLENLLENLTVVLSEGEMEVKTTIVDTIALNPPCRINILAREYEGLVRHRQVFVRWGIHFSCTEFQSPEDGQQASFKPDAILPVEITQLPQLIADRCVTEPAVVKELMRQHLYWLEEGGGSGAGKSQKCPTGILEILNSKACRSAIMFGDPLTTQECQELIGNLVKCKFPFQCAHGRPSMAPLAHIGRTRQAIDRARIASTQRSNSVNWDVWRKKEAK